MGRCIPRNLFSRTLGGISMKHTHACGAVIYCTSTNRILMQLRSHNSSFPLTWSLWGGKVEKDERPFQALQRELKEELGLVPEMIKVYPLHQYQSKDEYFVYETFCCLVNKEFVPTLNDESSGYCWVNVGFWPKPLHNGAKNLLYSKTFRHKLDAMIAYIHSEDYDSKDIAFPRAATGT